VPVLAVALSHERIDDVDLDQRAASRRMFATVCGERTSAQKRWSATNT
jgi:hypothetical protein